MKAIFFPTVALGAACLVRYLVRRRSRQKADGDFDVLADAGDSELTRVAFTSRWVAAERALEHARPDALFSDPFASYLGGKPGLVLSEKMKGLLPWPTYHITWMAVRTKYVDDRVTTFFATRDGAQYVNLGSGLDARVYRLRALARARAAFEVDVPEVVAAFNRAMCSCDDAVALCPRVSPAVDLAAPDALRRALRAAGFDARVPTFWLLEGLTMYLTKDVNVSLLEQINSLSAAGSQLCGGFIADTSWMNKGFSPAFAPAVDEYCALLREHGWSGEVVADRYGDANLNFGRYPEGRAPEASNCFVHATR